MYPKNQHRFSNNRSLKKTNQQTLATPRSKREQIQINKIWNKDRDITMETTEIQKITGDYYEQLNTNGLITVSNRQIPRHKHQDLIIKKEKTWPVQSIMKEIPAFKKMPRVWCARPWTTSQKGILFTLKFFFKNKN